MNNINAFKYKHVICNNLLINLYPVIIYDYL